MGAVSERHIDLGSGTPEADWLPWLHSLALSQVPLEHLVRPGERAVVVAPHPDDEVLMLGGLLAQAALAGVAAEVWAVTDGEASHPGSVRWPRDRLARQRAVETGAALALLGSSARVQRAGLPDGDVAGHTRRLRDWLLVRMRASDVVFTTWSLDGHPDHEATAHAVRAAASAVGARLFELPVWGWHWSRPEDMRMPWHRAVMLPLAADTVQRKCAAVASYATQWEPEPGCGATPVLRPVVLQRARRPFEILFSCQ